MLDFKVIKDKGNTIKNNIYNKEIIKRTDYIALRLIPTTSTKNEKTGDIAKKVNTMHKKFNKRYSSKKLSIEEETKLGFLIRITKEEINFYLILPRSFKTEMETTLENVWKGVNTELIEKDDIPKFDTSFSVTSIETELEDALSLRVDKRDNYLLTSVLGVVNLLNDEEEVNIFYNFMPKSNIEIKNARAKMKETNDKIKQNYSVKKKKGMGSLLKNASIQTSLYINDVVTDVLKEFGLKDVKSNSKDLTKDYYQKEISEASKNKLTKDLVYTQIAIFSKSNKGRQRQLELNSYVADNYDKISLDNDIIYNHKDKISIFKKKNQNIKEINILEYKLKNIPYNVFSLDEVQHFISLPGKTILEEYPMIRSIAYKQTIIDKCCQTGYLSLGTSENRKISTPVFLSNEDEDIRTNGVYLIGPQGCGKSTFFKRYTCDAVANGDVVIILDYIGTNELAMDIEKILPKNKIIIINLSSDIDERTQALAFNELDVSNIDVTRYKDYKKYEQRVIENLYAYADRMACLLDSINGEGPGGQLTNKMTSILRACCIITFSKPNQTINDLYRVITNHKVRYQYIEEMPQFIKEEVQDELDELSMKIDIIEYVKDEKTKRILKDENGEPVTNVVGTNEGAIINFLDRFNQLKRNYVMKRLLKISPENNLDFTKFMENGGQCVIVKIPENDYTPEAASVISNFYANKILMAIQERKARYVEDHPEDSKCKNMPLCHLLLDEVHKVPSAYLLISEWFTQFRKYRMKPVLAGHYIGQLSEAGIGKQGINRLYGTKFNYIMFRGLDEIYFNELKSKFKGIDFDELEGLPKYHAIVSAYYQSGPKVFVTKLPGDVATEGHPLFNKNS